MMGHRYIDKVYSRNVLGKLRAGRLEMLTSGFRDKYERESASPSS